MQKTDRQIVQKIAKTMNRQTKTESALICLCCNFWQLQSTVSNTGVNSTFTLV